MMGIKNYGLVALTVVICGLSSRAQTPQLWNNKSCAVVLTYDDAIDVDLDNVVPALDSLQLKGTFYLIGASPVISRRMKEWKAAAQEGHELGNHALFHPCDGSLPGRGFVTPDNDLSKYTMSRAVNEIRLNNTLLHAIDGKDRRTLPIPVETVRSGMSIFMIGYAMILPGPGAWAAAFKQPCRSI